MVLKNKMIIRNRQKESGFTLVEVVIVIALISILSAIGTTQLLQSLPGIRLRAAARDLYSNMQTARMNAVKNNTTWGLVFDPANNRYLVCSDSGADNVWSTTADNTVFSTINLSSYKSGVGYGHGSVTGNNSVPGTAFPVDEVSYNSNVLTFDSKGLGGAGYVYLDNQSNSTTYAVGTQASGVVSILMWQGTQWR